MARYRLFLYETAVARHADPATGGGARAGIAPGEVAALRDSADTGEGTEADGMGEGVAEDLAALAGALGGLLRGRVRYFSDGAVFGTAPFVDAVFAREKEAGRFGQRRRSGARRLRGADWGPLRVLRDLRKAVFG